LLRLAKILLILACTQAFIEVLNKPPIMSNAIESDKKVESNDAKGVATTSTAINNKNEPQMQMQSQ